MWEPAIGTNVEGRVARSPCVARDRHYPNPAMRSDFADAKAGITMKTD